MSTIYFGYGSNLWKDQMKLRCPQSQYLGIARLPGYSWIINDRGYANIVQNRAPYIANQTSKHATETWGLVYRLEPSDEAQLDINEGVPEAYTKEHLTVDFWPLQRNGIPDPSLKSEKTEMLVYIDRLRLLPHEPKKEYIFRMNRGISDAVHDGMPVAYLEEILRKFIPDVEDATVEKLARKQASLFEDER